MSETRETSWYEIALTHSQVVKIFVGLLLCLVGVFFSGIWIGRDAVNAVENVPLPRSADAGAENGEEGREVAQLNFFSDDDVVPDRAPAAVQPEPERRAAVEEGSPDTTLVDDLGAAGTSPAETPVPPPAATQVAEVRSAPPVNEPDAPVEVTRETAATASPAEAAGELVVQVFSSNDATQARRVLGRLAQGGHPAYLSPVEVSGRTMYRVRIGPYAERDRAEQVADTVRRTFKLDTWITQKST